MRKTWFYLAAIALALSAAPQIAIAQAQAANQIPMVSVPASTVTVEQRKLIGAEQTLSGQLKLPTSVEQAHNWVGVGKEVGEAMNSGLEAVTTQASKFADTKVGKFTMFLIAWRVIGERATAISVHLIVGLGIILFGMPVVIWSYRRMVIPRQVLDRIEYGDTKIPGVKSKIKFYKMFDPNEKAGDRRDAYAGWHWSAMAVLTALAVAAIFSF